MSLIPWQMPQYLYGRHPNVVTGIDYERIYSGTGPYGGRLVRPSDKTEPKKIAWLQCIGSRDLHTHSYCSSVCCMYAIKEAMIAKDYLPGVDTAIFYMDIRVCGKDYEQYYTRARDEYGVRFVCYRVPEIAPADNDDLKITYFDAEGKKQTEIFNMVVLSAGFEISDQAREMAGRLGIDLDRHHYPRTDPFVPVAGFPARGLCLRHLSGPQGYPGVHHRGLGRGILLPGLAGRGAADRGRSPRKNQASVPPARPIWALSSAAGDRIWPSWWTWTRSRPRPRPCPESP